MVQLVSVCGSLNTKLGTLQVNLPDQTFRNFVTTYMIRRSMDFEALDL